MKKLGWVERRDKMEKIFPELLEACKLLLKEWDNRGFPELNKNQCYSIDVLNGFALVRQAIAKAEGPK